MGFATRLLPATLVIGGVFALSGMSLAPAWAQTPGDSAAVAGVVTRFHAALASGDSAAALALLTPTVTIMESGSLESLREYRSHHLAADIAFARATQERRSGLVVRVRGDVAWTTATSGTRGNFRGKVVNSQGAELMVLTRRRDGWVISAIHWSSRDAVGR